MRRRRRGWTGRRHAARLEEGVRIRIAIRRSAPDRRADQASKGACDDTDGQPNILDDLGRRHPVVWDVSCYHRARWEVAPRTSTASPPRGVVHRLLRPAEAAPRAARRSSPGSTRFAPGCLKVGLPGAELGLRPEGPDHRDLLKNHGYVTGQFGKNHLGDRNEHLPRCTVRRVLRNLYHLDAEEEPEDPQYPKDPGSSSASARAGGAALQGDRHGRPDRRPALRQGRQAGHR